MNKGLFLVEFSRSRRSQFGKVAFDIQPTPQKVFSAIWSLESAVPNGGFELYFEGWDAETANFIVVALQTIQAHNTAAIYEDAIRIAFPDGLPKDPKDIQATAKKGFADIVERGLDGLAKEYCKDLDKLDDLLFEFVRQHPSEFGEILNTTVDGAA